MTTLVLAALGFDEKFIVRCITRNDPRNVAKVLLFRPLGGDEYSRRKSEEAWNNARMILEDYMGIDTDLREVDPTLIMEVIREARNRIMSWPGDRIVICGGSGMRALAIALVAASFALSKKDQNKVVIDIDLESSDRHVILRPSDVDRLKLTSREEKILEAVARLGEASVADIARMTELPKPTVSRVAKKLAQWGYLERVGRGIYKIKR